MTDLKHINFIQSEEEKACNTGCMPLHHAIYTDNTQEINCLIGRQADLLHARSKYNRTPLHAAACKGNLDLVQQFIEQGAELDAKDLYGKTPLYLATERGYLQMMKYLVNKGADVHIREEDEARSLLHVAAELDYDGIIRYLLSVAVDVNAKDIKDVTPCHLAARRRNWDITRYLIEKGKADTCLQDKEKETVLMAVVLRGNIKLLHIILTSRKECNKEFTDHEKEVLLHFGVQSDCDNMLKELILLNLPLNSQDPDQSMGGATPLHYAVSLGNINMINFLLDAGADMNTRDRKGRTPLNYVQSSGVSNIIALLENYESLKDYAACKQFFRGFL